MVKLIISPTAGMCNRFRVLSSYIAYGLRMNFEIYICWGDTVSTCIYPNQQEYMRMQNRKFTDFFEESFPQPNVNEISPNIIYTEWLPIDEWYKFQSDGQKQWLSRGLRSKLIKIKDSLPAITRITTKDDVKDVTILVETSIALKSYINENGERIFITEQDMHEIYNKYLIPKQKYLDYLNNLEETNIGISIRGGEFLNAYPETKYLFAPGNLTLLDWLFKIGQRKTITLFSDDHFFRDAIIFQYNYLRKNLGINTTIQTLNSVELNSVKMEKWEMPFIEFLYLAKKTSLIYGTPESSFAEQASIYGNKPYKHIIS